MAAKPLPTLVVLAMLLLVPLAQGHGGEEHAPTLGASEPGEFVPPNAGYTGPGRESYVSFFQGVWLYGQASATPIADQLPRAIRGDGDWLVWEDANRADIFLYSIAAGTGHYIMRDNAVQRNPQISGNVVVWEDYRHGNRPAIYAYFLDTAETRRLSTGPGRQTHPSIDGPLVAWEDDRDGTSDIWGHSLLNHTDFPIQVGSNKESDPLVVGEQVFFRTYRFGLWDIQGHDTRSGETFQVTTDTEIQGAPFTNGRDVLFLTQYLVQGWKLQRYDTRQERLFDTPLRMTDTARTSASGEHLLQLARDVGYYQLVARNVTTGDSNHISGNLRLAGEPLLLHETAYAAVVTKNGTSLLALDVSPFAFLKRPALTITSPSTGATLVRPTTVAGVLTMGSGWTEPVTFTYRLDDGAPQLIAPGMRWRFTVDNEGVDPGVHEVVIRATFREGPPVEERISLIVPIKTKGVDVEANAPDYHAARVLGAVNAYVLDNPASFLLIPLVLLLVFLVALRVWILVRPKKKVFLAEYVPPEEG